MILRFLFTVGFIPLILPTQTIADFYKNISNGKDIFYSLLPENEADGDDMEANDFQDMNSAMNNNDENKNSVPVILDYQNQCQIKENIHCDPSYPYRTLNGSCNNLDHPTWGISNGCFLRFQPAFYDGFGLYRKSKSGNPLPRPRDISLNMFNHVPRPSNNISFMFTIFGQTIAHDLSRAEIHSLDQNCCTEEADSLPFCAAIQVRPDDPFFSRFNTTCLLLHRTILCTDCSDKNRQQINAVTSSLDASILYGSDVGKSMQVRANDGTGKLNSNLTEKGELLPFDHSAHKRFCPLQKKCFFTGDIRVNQHSFLSAMETFYMREHNRIATKLKKLNPHWKEERLFQESRRIVIATLQCITYKEYLPLLLGNYIMKKFDLAVRDAPDGTKYNPNIQLGTRNEFATACFRLHSMIPRDVGSFGLRFKHVYQNPDLLINGHMEKITEGSCKVPSENFDRYFVSDITKYLGLYSEIQFGTDLASIDVQRSRDHGLPPYVVTVSFCSEGRINITSFDDIEPSLMPKKKVEILKRNYENVEDVDLIVGMHLENKFPGAVIGPTAVCIIAKQFYFSKFGDRFYFEHKGEVPSFTKAQRNSLRQCSLSRLLCDNTNSTQVQKFPMILPSPENPEVLCEDIPRLDLSHWKETP